MCWLRESATRGLIRLTSLRVGVRAARPAVGAHSGFDPTLERITLARLLTLSIASAEPAARVYLCWRFRRLRFGLIDLAASIDYRNRIDLDEDLGKAKPFHADEGRSRMVQKLSRPSKRPSFRSS
jgi:hypothetical protein